MNLTQKGSSFTEILTKVDPEKIKNKYPRPSTNKNYPTGIEPGDVSMTGTGSRNDDIRNQGSTDLEFEAYPGDVVSFSFTTPDNSACTISIYGVQDTSGRPVFGRPETIENSIELNVRGRGTANLMLSFGIYTKDGNGKPKDLFGCFHFDANITLR